MRIGEFSELTGITPRMLRYYEEQGLLLPAERGANGYRSYERDQIDRARRIADLLSYGLPTRLVADLLDSLTDAGGIFPEHVPPATVDSLTVQYERLCRCADCVLARRDALRGYLDRLGGDVHADGLPARD